jgi:hypothetical protein
MAKRKPFFCACGRCFSIFVCVGKKRRTLPKTREGRTPRGNRWSYEVGAPGCRRTERGRQQATSAFWAAYAPSSLPNPPKAQYVDHDDFAAAHYWVGAAVMTVVSCLPCPALAR